MGKKFSNTDKYHKPTDLRSTNSKIKEFRVLREKKTLSNLEFYIQ